MSAPGNQLHPTGPDHATRCLVVVQNGTSECPYRDSETARMPLCYPVMPLSLRDTDQLLDAGYRRSGSFLYQTQCPSCQACEPTRLDVGSFRWTDSTKRVLKRADRELTTRWGKPIVDSQRVAMYNLHRRCRGLDRGTAITASEYENFLTESCWATLELQILRGDELIGISIMDIGEKSVSAVYTYFDPEKSRFSLGTLAVLKQIQWAAGHARRWLYLGMYVASNQHLNYKSRFLPQQRLINGHWTDFESR